MKRILVATAGGLTTLLVASPAQAQDTFLGQIIQTPYNFCPRGYTPTDGQILSISQNTALFALLGTTYGGNGQTTFALPDLRGRMGVQVGQGPGLENYVLGELDGAETVSLLVNQLPVHSHVANLVGSSALPDTEKVKKATPATYAPATAAEYNRTLAPDTAMAAGSVTTDNAGGGQPAPIRDPYLVMRFCIATEGIFPARN
ncbi:MAG: tail fiber protein [Pseudomonadota bacterium]